ncbi:MCE family protein [Actinacidiphila yeochonensis]|uniref:MCE family protein n=1 Tax=Actinacidiphila yeochonensis TaxID=89050 RepID=UPI000ADFCB4C|nr:MCE family protein [Actinacidiphila yeochonensis]
MTPFPRPGRRRRRLTLPPLRPGRRALPQEPGRGADEAALEQAALDQTAVEAASGRAPATRRAGRLRAPGRVLVLAVVVAVVAAGAVAAGFAVLGGPSGIHVTAYFDRTVGVYAGSDLRVLGVKVGTVESVHPDGTRVRARLRLDHGVKVPAGADAVVVAPSVVAERYVQLTPAYTGGPRMKDHGVIPVSRTATPVEIDQLYSSITQLSKALGPTGSNADGALSDLLTTGSANLKGNGKDIGAAIDQFGQAAKTLDGSRDDLFATLGSLQSFTTMLKNSDSQVKSATDELGDVSSFLADDSQDLGGALRQLSTSLDQVKTFIQDNRAKLRTGVDKLTPITQTLVDQRASLAELLDDAPLAADNLMNAYDPATGTLDGRADLNELSMGSAAASSSAAGTAAGTASGTAPAAAPAGMAPRAQGAGALPLPLPAVGTVYGPTTAKGATR